MTSEFSDDRRGSLRAPLWRLAHWTPTAFMAVALLALAAFWVPQPIQDWVLWPLAAVTLVLIAAFLLHVNSLCEICAGMTELDGNAAAERHDRDLRRFHSPIMLGVALGALFATLIVTLVFNLPLWVNQFASSACTLATALSFRAWNRHRLLEPWCRYCRRRRPWDEGGPREPSPRPDPATETTTPRT